MAISSIRLRLPAGQDVLLAGATCAVPVHSYAVLQFLNGLPSWTFYLDTWDLIGTFAYFQVFALLESLTVLAALLLLSALLPATLLRAHFVSQSGLMVLTGAVCAFVLQYQRWITFSASGLPIYLAVSLVAIVAAGLLARRFALIQRVVRGLADRLLVLLYFYLALSGASVLIILVRMI